MSKNQETKVCKICGWEKPVKEFRKHEIDGKVHYETKCRVCTWFKSKDIQNNDEWTHADDIIIIDNILNHKANINQIAEILHKSLYNLCFRIKNILKLGGQTKLPVVLICKVCNKQYDATPSNVLNGRQNCSQECSNIAKIGVSHHKVTGMGNCIFCNKEFEILDNVSGKKFCSSYCKNKYYSANGLNKIKTNCINCNKEIYKTKKQIKENNNCYCSLGCEKEYKHKQFYEYRLCEICNEEYECRKSSTQRFCSPQCQSEWQSQFLVGENANNFNQNITIEDRIKICEWCGKEFQVKPFKIETAKFCSNKCRQEHFAQVVSQTDGFKEKSRKRAVNILESGCISFTMTAPQIQVNELFKSLNIKIKNEKGFTYYSIDNYLIDYNLAIEVMGTYWHCDCRKYPIINYDLQVNRIKIDKAKHTYLKNYYNIEILYLWEEDINKNSDLCIELIKEYIKNNGVLKNYHSFNYHMDNVLKLNDNIIIPYMDWDISDLNKIIDLTVKEKMSRKDPSKWITFNCEVCGIEKEELISHFNKKEHHYCSRKCMGIAGQNRISVKCSHCGKDKEIKTSLYSKNKTKKFFCDKNCELEYRRTIGFKTTGGYVEYHCENCGKLHKAKTGDFNRSKHHFCSQDCARIYRKKHYNKRLK